jgi:hypothetical protein
MSMKNAKEAAILLKEIVDLSHFAQVGDQKTVMMSVYLSSELMDRLVEWADQGDQVQLQS